MKGRTHDSCIISYPQFRQWVDWKACPYISVVWTFSTITWWKTPEYLLPERKLHLTWNNVAAFSLCINVRSALFLASTGPVIICTVLVCLFNKDTPQFKRKSTSTRKTLFQDLAGNLEKTSGRQTEQWNLFLQACLMNDTCRVFLLSLRLGVSSTCFKWNRISQ